MNKKELVFYGFQGIGIICLFGYFFYRSIIITVLSIPLTAFYLRYKSEELYKKQKNDLKEQFKDTLVSVSGSYKAGYSLENAFLEAYKEMRVFYGDNSIIVKELYKIKMGLGNNIPLTKLIRDMGQQSGVGDIKDFAGVLVIGKQTGGNIAEIMDTFISVSEEKVAVMREIETILSSKKYEQRVMNIIPFFIIFYIEITSKGFFDVLYNNILGRIIMTICLVIYVGSVVWAERITNITI